jgi:hypothetical protein
MSKRYLVLGMSVVLALALAVPAFGGPTNPIASISASVKQTANKALKTAKQAKKQANNALNVANGAQSSANNAQNTANGADKAADSASKAAASAASAAKKAQETADGVKGTAESAKATADSAKATADEAKILAQQAEANANTRLKGVYFKFGTSSAEDTETTKNVSAFCNSGDEATGGGWAFNGSTNVTVSASTPTLYGDGWFVTGKAISGTPTWSIQANAVCTEK